MRVLGDVRDGVGESPIWDETAGCLWSVDITGRAIRRRWLDGRTDNWETDDLPTALALTEDGTEALVAFAAGLAVWSSSGAPTRWIARPERDQRMRLNEGKCDPSGRFWVASMENNLTPDLEPRVQEAAIGRIFRLDGSDATSVVGPEFAIPNTMAWSPDRRRFYAGDSVRNLIWAWDYDDATGELSNRRVHVEGGPGLPDGSAIDSEGALWTARFAGGCVIRTTADGRTDRIVKLPLANPTSCAFGGMGLHTLFVTSARFGLEVPTETDGATLAVEVDVTGIREPRWRGPS